MKTQHTPGPWKCSTYGQRISIDTENNEVGIWGIAHINPDGDGRNGIPSASNRANARLIAAAPDLLEILKEALDVMGTWDDAEPGWATTARAAIAKAGGDK